MIKVALIRGKYFNNFEGQNYIFSKKSGIQITAVTSLRPIHSYWQQPMIKLSSIADLPFGKFNGWIANRLIGDSQVLFGLEKLKNSFDIFHTADPHYYYSYQLARLRAQNKIKKLIVTSWETIPFNNESVQKKREIKRFVLKHVDLFICYTQRAKGALILEGVDENKIEVMRLGVDIDKFKIPHFVPLSGTSRGKQKKSITILFVGRLVKEKGINDLVKIMKNLKSRVQNGEITFRIIGDGPMKNQLKPFVKSEIKSYEEMPRVYREADIFIMPSRNTKTWEEQYGMVLVEAMASGLPIVGYNSGAVQEIVQDTGIIIPEGNIKELIHSIDLLIKSPEKRIELGKKGRIRAEQFFNSKKTAEEIGRIYNNVMNH